MRSAIDALGQVRSIYAEGGQLPDDLQGWMAQSIDRFLRQQCDSLNEAFGLQQGRGGVPWWREKAIRARDEALRELAQRHFADLAPSAQANAILKLSTRYAGTAWGRDSQRANMPEHYEGGPQAHLWRAFKSGAKMPVSGRHLRNLLAA